MKIVIQFASRLTDKLHFDDARIKITELWTFLGTDLSLFFGVREKKQSSVKKARKKHNSLEKKKKTAHLLERNAKTTRNSEKVKKAKKGKKKPKRQEKTEYKQKQPEKSVKSKAKSQLSYNFDEFQSIWIITLGIN